MKMFAILENNLNDDGTVKVPEVLRAYLGEQERICAPTAA